MFCSYQGESQGLLIVFVVQILLRQNKPNNLWLAVSLSHHRNGSVIYFGGQAAKGQMWSQLNAGIDSDTMHYGSQEQKCQVPGWHRIYLQNLKERRLQYTLREQLWHLYFLNDPDFQGGCLAQLDVAVMLLQNGQRLAWPKANTSCSGRGGSPATPLYEPIVVDLPFYNVQQHKSACVQRSAFVGRVLVLSEFHG